MTIFLSVGEASGELHGKNLAAELHARRANLRIVGFGDARLTAAGVDVLRSLVGGAGMGLLHGIGSAGRHIGVAVDFVECLDRERPAAAVFVDNPGFHLVLASLARARGVPAIQYVCPQTWAWAPWRWRRMRRDLAAALAIVPFEVPYFGERGIAVRLVGHPIGDEPAARAADPNDRESWHSGAPLVALFPGSREAEVRRHAPTMLRVAAALRREIPGARFAMAIREPRLAETARALLAAIDPNHPIELREGPFDRWACEADLAIAKSGTVTLEIARYRVPLVVIYRVARVFDRAGSRYVLAVPNFSMLNLLAAREVVPEILYVRDDEEPRIVAPALELLRDAGARRAQYQALARILPLIDSPGASARAAEAILAIAEARLAASGAASAPPASAPRAAGAAAMNSR
jgi:lipid-A-disaccharide synthase